MTFLLEKITIFWNHIMIIAHNCESTKAKNISQFKKVNLGPLLWCSRWSCHLRCWNPIWVPLRVLALPLLIQVCLFERCTHTDIICQFIPQMSSTAQVESGGSTLKPGARDAVQPFSVGGKNPTTWAITPASKGLHQQEAGIRSSSWESNLGAPSWVFYPLR